MSILTEVVTHQPNNWIEFVVLVTLLPYVLVMTLLAYAIKLFSWRKR